MKRALHSIKNGAIISIVLFLALLLVLDSIFKFSDWSLQDIRQMLSKLTPQTVRRDEVKNYVLFTTVKFGRHEVTTGTNYASTQKQVITKQWCYLSTSSPEIGADVRLTLAQKHKGKAVYNPAFHPKALATFNLSERQAKSLTKTHCRFQ